MSHLKQPNGSMIVGFHLSLKAALPCHYVFPGVYFILTQHIGYAISDYHIHNSVCMFELPL